MNIFGNFIAVMLALITGFSSSYVEMNVTPLGDRTRTPLLEQVEDGSAIAQQSKMSAGIVVIDRAKNNYMATNGELAYQKTPIYSLGRLPILLHVIRVEPQIVKDAEDVIMMMEGSSGEAAERLWDKFGGPDIVRTISQRYTLEQTTAGNSWNDTESTAVDIARMYRRFLDDKEVSIPQKKWVMTILRKTSPTILGEDFSWGLPTVANVPEVAEQNRALGWVQGYTPSGFDPMIRATTGVVNSDMRYIVIIIGQTPPNTRDSAANNLITQVTKAVLGEEISNNKGLDGDEDGREFRELQKRLYGDFIKKS